MFGAPEVPATAAKKATVVDNRKKIGKQAMLDAFVKTNELNFDVFEKSGLLESAVMFNDSKEGEGCDPENFTIDPIEA